MLECPKCRSVRCCYGVETSITKSGAGLTAHAVVVCDDCLEITRTDKKEGFTDGLARIGERFARSQN
jgi:hypothetical protein